MDKVLFAVNGPWRWYQLQPQHQGWWVGSLYEEDIPPQKVRAVPCCALPDKLPLDWFDSTGVLPVSGEWEPEQYSPSARAGGRVPGLGIQKRPWVREGLDIEKPAHATRQVR